MTSFFKKMFKDRSTEAQLAETKPGEWKKHLDKSEYSCFTGTKIGTLPVVVGASFLAAATLPVLFGVTAAIAGILYVRSAFCQAALRTDAEKEIGIEKPHQKLQNFGKQLVRLF